ncbi:MAG: alpha/beta hydrolase [Planctomycetota bacterium]|nr:MAG: alpha/beta hydrolase [Planctomycetota bacterium]
MGPMLISIAAVLFIAYWGLGVILYLMQPVFLYSPTREVTYTPGELGLDFDSVVFQTGDGLKLTGWYIPAENSELTVLFCHGNGGNMMHRLDSINIFYNLGLNCFIFDYRGYGNSEGKPTEEGTYLDAAAAYKWLTEEKKMSPDNIIIFGRSLGGSIAAQLASKVKARALILESSFTSYVDMGKKFYPYMPVRWFASYSYRTINYIKDVHCPVMVIHSRNDEIVPFEFSLELHEAANEPKELIELSGSHNDGFLVSSEIYKSSWIKLLKFLEEYKSESARQQAS